MAMKSQFKRPKRVATFAVTTLENAGAVSDIEEEVRCQTSILSELLVCALFALSECNALAQGVSQQVSSTSACTELNENVMAYVMNERFDQAEIALSSTQASGPRQPELFCVGQVLDNLSVLMARSGRFAKAELFAERSVKVLEKSYASDGPVLLLPLQMLATTRFEQGKTAKAREAFRRMQSIRTERPEYRALVSGTSAAFLLAAGRRREAEAAYFAALAAWREAGYGDTQFEGVILLSLVSLYGEEKRFDEARQVLDRALAIFAQRKDTVPLDRAKLLIVQAALHARLGELREAERELADALSILGREPHVDSIVLATVLTKYAKILRKTHHRREARSVEARAWLLRGDHTPNAVVDVTDLLPKQKSRRN
jgi:tetratricopeptide (TPR) repeat protein